MEKYLIPTEHEECVVLVEYLKLKNIKHTHINNEMWTNSWKQKMKAKKEGVSRGFPDYLILLPGKLLFIEMKRVKGGKVSPQQKEWIEELNKIGSNVEAIVCKGADIAIDEIEKRLKIKSNKELLTPYKVY